MSEIKYKCFQEFTVDNVYDITCRYLNEQLALITHEVCHNFKMLYINKLSKHYKIWKNSISIFGDLETIYHWKKDKRKATKSALE